jgi:hypothetical protein
VPLTLMTFVGSTSVELGVVASVIFIVIVAALFVFLTLYGRNGRRDNWLTRPIMSGRNGRVEFFPKRWDPSDGPKPEATPTIWARVVVALIIVGIAIVLVVARS